jgi:uncharacterized membrane protein YdbT with pleckstrin-like domain
MPIQPIAGERLLLPPVRHHWILMVRKMVLPVAGALLFLYVLDSAGRALLPDDIRLLLGLAALAALGLRAIAAWLRWMEDTLTLTDQRVILEAGVLRRTSVVIPLGRIQDVVTAQGPLGRLLDYGAIEIDAAGGCSERFAPVRSPEWLRDRLFAVTGRVGLAV